MDANVLLVVLDSVRARNTSLHGHVNETTPFLRRFARERRTWYEEVRAPAARSLDSHASLFSGLPVEKHGVTRVGQKLAAETTVFDELRERGYRTRVSTENSFVTEVDTGLRDALDTVVGPHDVPFPDALDPSKHVL